MEKILKEILNEIKTMKSQINNLEVNVSGINKIEVTVNGMKEEINKLDVTVNGMKEEINKLDVTVNGMKEEHGRMLRAILESKEVQRGEIDTLTHRTAKIEGTIKGTAKQILNDLKEVSNQ